LISDTKWSKAVCRLARLRSERASLRSTPIACDVSAFHADWSVQGPHALEQLFCRESPSRVLLDCSLHLRTTLRMPLRGSNKKRFPSKAILGKEQFLETLSLFE
jgi:hypothetical protein